MNMWQQLLIVLGVLAALPLAITILWKLRLLPLALYFVSTRLFFPKWAAANEKTCIILFALCVLFAVVMWMVKIILWRREELEIQRDLLARATPLYGDWRP